MDNSYVDEIQRGLLGVRPHEAPEPPRRQDQQRHNLQSWVEHYRERIRTAVAIASLARACQDVDKFRSWMERIRSLRVLLHCASIRLEHRR